MSKSFKKNLKTVREAMGTKDLLETQKAEADTRMYRAIRGMFGR